jgi:hypothetical protein
MLIRSKIVADALTTVLDYLSACLGRQVLWQRFNRQYQGSSEMPCVYTTPAGLCEGKAPLSANQRYLPRALGNFQNNEPLIERICDDCQKVCSQLEDVFAHNSPEAFFREMIGRVGRKNHKRKNIF